MFMKPKSSNILTTIYMLILRPMCQMGMTTRWLNRNSNGINATEMTVFIY